MTKEPANAAHSELQQMLQALLASEESFRNQSALLTLILNSIGDGVVVSDPDGNLILFNDSAKRMLRRGLTSAPPEQWSEEFGVFYPDQVTPYPAQQLPLARAIRGETCDQISLFICHEDIPDGVLISCDARPVFDLEGRIRGGVAIFRDITLQAEAEKALQRSESRYRALFENLPIGAYRTTPDGEIVDVNYALVQMLGYSSRHELIHHNLETEEFEPEYDRQDFRSRLEKDGFITGLESVWKKKDGEKVFIRENANARRNSSGNIAFYEGTVEDITERKLVEKQKEEILSIVSHELRTPLTSVLLSLEFLLKKNSEPERAQSQRAIQLATQSAERMLRLINDILDLDKIESGKMRFQMQPVALTPLLKQALDAFDSYSEKFGVRFCMENNFSHAFVYADPDRLTQVLTNLLSNAVKFSPAGEAIVVSVLRHENQIRVCVKDKGHGIPEQFQHQVFNKFSQADHAYDSKMKGTGLGLSISKAIIEKMGGHIGFMTQPNGGTTFYFDLPKTL